MPCFRGINIFIGTESELEGLPEYPHPDPSSVNVVRRGQPASSPSSRSSSVHLASERTPTSRAKANPQVSMYIPSLPGIRFWIQYSVIQIPTVPCHLYFKLFSNGRHVTSWGIDPARITTGTVAKGLYEPDESWHYRDEDGDVLKQEGVESRTFHFADSSTNSSPTQDGGMIEVQVFRAKGRRRCAPRLEQSRNLDECGILSPSGSLLERPEDAVFYDWLLLDPRDSPYATFRFYHRPWAGLQRLNVIPPPRTATSAGAFPYGALDGAPTTPPVNKSAFEPGFENELSRVGYEGNRTPKTGIQAGLAPDGSPRRENRATWALTNPPEFLQARSSSPCLPQPSKKARDGFLDKGLSRPLPALPSRPSPLKRSSPGASLSIATRETPPMPTRNRAVPDTGTDRVVHDPLSPPGPPTPPPLPFSPTWRGTRQKTLDASLGSGVGDPRYYSPTPDLTAFAKGAVDQRPGRILADQPVSPPSPSRNCAEANTKPQPTSPYPKFTPTEAQCLKNPEFKASPPGKAYAHGTGLLQLAPSGMPALPRGLLGPALTEIPLRGPTGELMKKLRSENPFRDG